MVEMLLFFFSDVNFWFSCVFGIVVVLFVMEVVGMFMGISLFGFVDDQVDFDVDVVVLVGSLIVFVSWLLFDCLLFMVWLVILFIFFGIIGIFINMVFQFVIGGYFLVFIVVIILVIVVLIIIVCLGGVIVCLLLKYELFVISLE